MALLDTLLLLVYAALQKPGGTTGFEWHEWVGIAFIPLFIIHIMVSWRWVTSTWQRFRSDPPPRARINFLLNGTLFVMMTVVVISGLVISQYSLPALGLAVRASGRWERLHNSMSTLITPVAALHLALNWTWIRRAMGRYLVPWARREPGSAEGDPG